MDRNPLPPFKLLNSALEIKRAFCDFHVLFKFHSGTLRRNQIVRLNSLYRSICRGSLNGLIGLDKELKPILIWKDEPDFVNPPGNSKQTLEIVAWIYHRCVGPLPNAVLLLGDS